MHDIGLTERMIALVGAIIVGILASVALYNDRKATGLDNNVTKLLLGLMALGCVLVILAATRVLGSFGA